MAKEQKDESVDVIRSTHKKLRKELASGLSFDILWEKHCSDHDSLCEYSNAMEALATTIWNVGCDGKDRNQWVREVCTNYFANGGLLKQKNKDKRRKLYYNQATSAEFLYDLRPKKDLCYGDMASKSDISEVDLMDERLKLLDVGSCYNPFQNDKDFDTTAIDLSPANDTVYKCDFLNVHIGENIEVVQSEPSKNYEATNTPLKCISTLPQKFFHVVVFSLLLTYIPSPHKRWVLCKRAHEVLKTNGLLLIITPDSSHQNRHAALMKMWQAAIESIGYQRIIYSKDTHLHLLAFRKVPSDFIWDVRKIRHTCSPEELQKLHIPQDFHEFSTDEELSINREDGKSTKNAKP